MGKASTQTLRRTGGLATRISCVDVFCGVGGLTHGLLRAGVHVGAGLDLDSECRYPYETNNSAQFIEANVCHVTGESLSKHFRKGHVRLLAGCAPCQPFSTYSQARDPRKNKDWGMLTQFGRLVRELEPELVTIENVPQLAGQRVFNDFVRGLRRSGYHVWHAVVDCAEYGLPQSRRRLVLIASAIAEIALLTPKELGTRRATVRSTIGKLPKLVAGGADKNDPLHVAAGMSELNLRRIRASLPGGTWNDWPAELRAACHQKETGSGYRAVYGRMEWGKPAPTMTTLCHGFGNGRFGHPDQDRGISLREAAMLQTFPKRYAFVSPASRIRFTSVGRMIGNAVPPKLGEIIGKSLMHHVTSVRATR